MQRLRFPPPFGHLGDLEELPEAGLVEWERRRNWAYYRLGTALPPGAADLLDALEA